MGTWGVGLFDDDLACDVRAEYRDLLADGLSGPEATRRLVRDLGEAADDEEEGPIFWLALAATQWRYGRLEDRVKARALRIIDRGTNLDLWAEEDAGRRRAVLNRLRQKLLSPQPPARKVRKPYQDVSPWPAGTILAYRLRSGKQVLLQVVDDRGLGSSPILTVLDWIGKKLPAEADVRRLPPKPGRRMKGPYLFMAVRRKAKDLPADRLTPLPVRGRPWPKINGGYYVFCWDRLDEDLERTFGWK